MIFKIAIFYFLFSAVAVVNAQDINLKIIESDSSEYHSEIPSYFKKSGIILPVSEIVGINCGLGLFNNYVTKEPFARISFNSIINNFK